jgi:hypothetical protein
MQQGRTSTGLPVCVTHPAFTAGAGQPANAIVPTGATRIRRGVGDGIITAEIATVVPGFTGALEKIVPRK